MWFATGSLLCQVRAWATKLVHETVLSQMFSKAFPVYHVPVKVILGVVSLMFHKLSEIISPKYTMPEITFTVRISSWNLVCVPKAWLWAHVQSFSLKFSSEVRFLQYTNFKRISWRARKMLVKQPPGYFQELHLKSMGLPKISMETWQLWFANILSLQLYHVWMVAEILFC